MKTLILGGTRFIGRALVQKLLETGLNHVTILNRGLSASEIDPAVNIIKAERSECDQMVKALKGKEFDVVYDLSGYNRLDVENSLNALQGRVGHYVFCSSIAVCKQPPAHWPLIEESAKCESSEDDEYGYNKWQAEMLLWQEITKRETDITIIRPAYVYGPHNYFDRELFVFERVRRNLPVIIEGSGENIVQFGYVGDLASAFIIIALNKKAYGQAFNISGQELVTVNCFIETAAQAIGGKVNIVHVQYRGEKNDQQEFARFPKTHRFSDISKAEKLLGLLPKSNLLEGMAKTAEWWLLRHKEN